MDAVSSKVLNDDRGTILDGRGTLISFRLPIVSSDTSSPAMNDNIDLDINSEKLEIIFNVINKSVIKIFSLVTRLNVTSPNTYVDFIFNKCEEMQQVIANPNEFLNPKCKKILISSILKIVKVSHVELSSKINIVLIAIFILLIQKYFSTIRNPMFN